MYVCGRCDGRKYDRHVFEKMGRIYKKTEERNILSAK